MSKYRYFVHPERDTNHSGAYTESRHEARELRARLMTITREVWCITAEPIPPKSGDHKK